MRRAERTIAVIFLAGLVIGISVPFLLGAGDYKDRGDFTVRDDLLLYFDEEEVVWYNWDDGTVPTGNADGDDANDANTVSVRASESLTESYLGRWPIDRGDPNTALCTTGDTDAQWFWGSFTNDANCVLPVKTPWNVMYVGSDGYPLTEDPNYFTYYAPERAFGVGIEYIGEGLYANNYIQVYTLLDFDPNLYNTTIGRGSDDTATGPNNVSIGYAAGDGLATGYQNSFGGRGSGQAVKARTDNAFWGFESGKNVGGGTSLGGSGYEFTFASDYQYLYGFPLYNQTMLTLDAGGAAADEGGGIVSLPCAGSPFVAGDVIVIYGTTNYGGPYTLTAGTSSTELQFASAYNAETFDGTETLYMRVTLPTGTYGYGDQDNTDGAFYVAVQWTGTGYIAKWDPTTRTVSSNWTTPADWPIAGVTGAVDLKITPDGAYFYINFSDSKVRKYDTATWTLQWTTEALSFQGGMAMDDNGICYVLGRINTGEPNEAIGILKLDAATGTPTIYSAPAGYTNTANDCELHVDSDMGIIISGGATNNDLQPYTMAIRTLADDAGDDIVLPEVNPGDATICRHGVTTAGGYIFALEGYFDHVLYKYSWDGDEAALEDSLYIANSQCVYTDLWGNLVVCCQNWSTPITTVFRFYDTDLTLLNTIDVVSGTMAWWAVGTAYKGDFAFYPGVTEISAVGNGNTAVGSGALRGVTLGAEPNEATAGGYHSQYAVEAGDQDTSYGAYSLGQLSTGSHDIALGPWAGWPITTEDDYIVFDSRQRTSIANMESQSIIVGQTADDPNDQWLNLNVGALGAPYARFDVNDVNVGNDLTLQTATASRLLATDADKVAVSTDLNNWIAGTANRVTVADDGDGTVTLSTPQDTHTGASPTFAGETLTGDTLNIATPGTISTPTDTGTKGDIRWTGTYLYVCVAANTWKRTALSTWTISSLLLETGDLLLLESGDELVLEE